QTLRPPAIPPAPHPPGYREDVRTLFPQRTHPPPRLRGEESVREKGGRPCPLTSLADTPSPKSPPAIGSARIKYVRGSEKGSWRRSTWPARCSARHSFG